MEPLGVNDDATATKIMMEEFMDGLKSGPNGTIARTHEENEVLALLIQNLKGITKSILSSQTKNTLKNVLSVRTRTYFKVYDNASVPGLPGPKNMTAICSLITKH